MTTDLDKFLQGYIECALWSSNDESTESGGEPLDSNYSVDDIAPETIKAMRDDCEDFMIRNQVNLIDYCIAIGNRSDYSGMECAGHDFWLTRNGHGSGFWDRELCDLGDSLTKAAEVYSSVDLYVGDDGLIHS